MGFFGKLFKKTPSTILASPVDLSILQTDIHAHFLPGLDDGSQNMEETIVMLQKMVDLGYKKLICTPHIMSDFYKNTPEGILAKLEEVKAEIKKHKIPLELEAAAEYYMDFDLERKLEEGNLLTFGDNYLLFEVSYINKPDNFNSTVFNMITKDYKPVLAHPERYPFWYNDVEAFEGIKDRGILLQVNINSFSGHYSPEAKATAEMLVEKGWVDFIGTDCHRIDHLHLLEGRSAYEKGLHDLLASGKLKNNRL